jgi:hypothetical protein
MHKRSFSVEGRSFTIKAEPNAAGWAVQVFDGTRVVLPIKFNVSSEVEIDFHSVYGDMANYLMDFAENEVKNRVKQGGI